MIPLKKFIFSTLLLTTTLQCMEQQDIQHDEDNSKKLNQLTIAQDKKEVSEDPEFYFGRNSNFEKMLKDFLYLPDSPRSNLVRKARDEYHFTNYELPHQNLSKRKLKEKEEYFITIFGKPALEEMQRCNEPKEMHKRAKKLQKIYNDLRDEHSQLEKEKTQQIDALTQRVQELEAQLGNNNFSLQQPVMAKLEQAREIIDSILHPKEEPERSPREVRKLFIKRNFNQ